MIFLQRGEIPERQQVLGLTKESEALTWQRDLTVSYRRRFPPRLSGSHGLELVDALLGVALTDLTQRLVLVPACPDVLSVQHVILCLLGVVSSLSQL